MNPPPIRDLSAKQLETIVKSLVWLETPRYTKLDNLHNKPITTFVSEVLPYFQQLTPAPKWSDFYLMDFLCDHVHEELSLWIREPQENEEFDVWIREVQIECDEIREEMHEDIALGVLPLPTCCASFRCAGAQERVALLGPQSKDE